MTGMEHAIEQVAKRMHSSYCECEGWYAECQGPQVGDRRVARRLAAEGLIAPAPLREEWRAYDQRASGEARATDQSQASLMAHELAMDDEDNGSDSDWTVQRRHVTAWLPVDGAEGDGSADR